MGTDIRIWQIFWTASLLIAGSCFVSITIVVIVKGARDLRAMIRGLAERRESGND
ncbi:MAG TPA: hypothetical protein VKV15_07355 [Bryobacteraceae bacterium]|nr:hypothetical protein [Bryobacteraceae bacterium]